MCETRIDFGKKGSAAAILFLILLFLPLASASGTEYYALRLEGSDCRLCHLDPGAGTLNDTGGRFQEQGYRYPVTYKGLLFFSLWGVTLFFFVLGFHRRSRLWLLGRRGEKWNQWDMRWKGMLRDVLGHRTILRRFFPGLSHMLLFWSFFVLSLTVAIIFFQEYLSPRFIDSENYPYIRLFLDLFGAAGLIGTVLLGFRRYLLRPKELDDQQSDALSLLLLFLVFSTGLMVTGSRNEIYQSRFLQWAPAASWGASFLKLFFEDLTGPFSTLWWAHLFLSFSLLGYIPFSRLFHIFSSSSNILLRSFEPKGALSKVDLDASETFGAEKLEDLPWKALLELDACTRCGRCQEGCPAHLTGKHLNPKRVIQNMKRYMERPAEVRNSLRLVGDVVTEDEIWECTTCRNCLEQCPVFIEPMVQLMEFRRSLVLNHGRIPKEPHFAFRNIERKGNPWGFDPAKRMWWAKEKGVRELSPGDSTDLLFWVGCYGSYDDRNIEIALSMTEVLNRIGLDFGILGSGEWCCGIDLRRMGSEYLFQVTAEKNLDRLRALKFKRILTTCPHCFNTLKNEYPQFGGGFDVVHYTTLVEELIRDGRLPLNAGGRKRVTYHDSCYLGRYNDGYDPPRNILGSMADLTLLEMERSREEGFCCGGGGCHMWMEERAGRRINEMRVEQAVKTGAEIIATVCPLCLTSLDSAVKVLDLVPGVRVMDILELVRERLL
jgi:Fe-S oxidoreductase/nitrate reductase gamma subunit